MGVNTVSLQWLVEKLHSMYLAPKKPQHRKVIRMCSCRQLVIRHGESNQAALSRCMYAFHLFGTMDSFLLAIMAVDQFVAIVHPLRYSVIMSSCA
ncbi:Olfactory Receptor 1I1 [Manis pentadactyla]|nr:Olfactory Receptor 1I1 [Manis pentadactyla]